MQRLVVFFALILAVTGCVSPGEKLDDSLVAQIHDGSSTRQEVEQMFGPPRSTFTGSNGKQVGSYEFSRMTEKDDPMNVAVVKRRIRLRTLSVLYGKDDRVERHHLYESGVRGSATATGARIGSFLGPPQLALIHRGISTRKDLVQYFGDPLGEHLTTQGDLLLVWLYLEKDGPMSFVPRKQVLEVIINGTGTVLDFRVAQDASLGPKP